MGPNYLEELVTGASKRVGGGWLSILMEFLPAILELFSGILEDCAVDRADAIALICDPSNRDFRTAAQRIRYRLRRDSDEFRAMPWRMQRAHSFRLVRDISNEANDRPELVGNAFDELAA